MQSRAEVTDYRILRKATRQEALPGAAIHDEDRSILQRKYKRNFCDPHLERDSNSKLIQELISGCKKHNHVMLVLVLSSIFSSETRVPTGQPHAGHTILNALRLVGTFTAEPGDFTDVFVRLLGITGSRNSSIPRGLTKTKSKEDVQALGARLNELRRRTLEGRMETLFSASKNEALFNAP